MIHRSVCSVLALLLILPWTPPAAAQSPAPAPGAVTLEQIMAHPDWLGTPPENPYWSDDGRAVYYERKRKGEDRRDLYRLDPETGQSTLVAPADLGAVDAPGGDLSRDRRWKVYEREGDIFLKNLETGALRQITRTGEAESDPQFLTGDNRVSFLRGHQPFVYDLVSGLLSQAADIRLEKDPAEEDEPGYRQAQQKRLFDIVRERQEKEKKNREQEEAEQKADPTRPPLPFYLGKDIEIAGSFFSPAGDWLVLVTAAKEEKEEGTIMARFVTDSGDIEARDVRTKVGKGPKAHQLLLLDLAKHEKHEIGFAKLPGFDKDPLKELREKAKKERDLKDKDQKDKDTKDGKDSKDGKDKDKKDDKAEEVARAIEALEIHWSQDGRYAGLVLRALDNKDRWIVTLEREKPELAVRHRLTDPAWINFDFNEFGWIPESHEMYFLSEESGYSQLYFVSMKDGKVRRMVNGDYEVSIPVPSRDGSHLYYVANASHPGVQEAWRIDVKSGKTEQLTKLGGLLTPVVSPDESRLLLLRSAINRHDELYVQEIRSGTEPGAEARQVTQTHSAEFLAQDWAMPEIVPIPSTHVKAPIYSRVYTPKGFDPGRKYPAVVFTHGAGYLQNAHAGWSNYFREYMFHTLLTQRGYVVLDMDYRASAGYGRDWRTAIYRQMGHPEVEDLEDGVAWLIGNKSVDPQRVGTYGGSYGGFLTFMAMFRKPDLFAAGAALRPVTDWAHYNHEYTSNILNTPEVDPEAFARELADRVRGRAPQAAPDLHRHGGRQRLLPGLRPPGAAPDRAEEGEFRDRDLPGGAPHLPAADELARRVPADPQAVRDPPEVGG